MNLNYYRMLSVALVTVLGACALDGDEEFTSLELEDNSGKADGLTDRDVMVSLVEPALEIEKADGKASGTARVLTQTTDAVRLRLHPTYIHTAALAKTTRITATTSRSGGKVALIAHDATVQGPATQITCKKMTLDAALFSSLTIDPATRTIDVDDKYTFTFEQCGMGATDTSQLLLVVTAVPVPSTGSYLGDYPFTVVVDNLEN